MRVLMDVDADPGCTDAYQAPVERKWAGNRISAALLSWLKSTVPGMRSWDLGILGSCESHGVVQRRRCGGCR